MKKLNTMRLCAVLTLLAVAVGLFFIADLPATRCTKASGELQLCFVDGMTHGLPTADNSAKTESRLDEAVKTVYFRLRSDSAVSNDSAAYTPPLPIPLARVDGRGLEGDSSSESG